MLEYELRHHEHEKTIIRAALATGRPIPKKIAEAPDLDLGLELYYSAFFELMTQRTGMGDGPISWLAVSEYATVHEFDSEQREALHYYITRMDDAYLAWAREHAKTKTKGK